MRRPTILALVLCAALLGAPVAAGAATWFTTSPPSAPSSRAPGVSAATRVPQAARAFLERHPAQAGLARPEARLALTDSRREADGSHIVRFQQQVRGIPVIGAESIVNLDAANRVTAAVAERLDGPTPDLDAALPASDAVATALHAVARQYGVPLVSLVAGAPATAIHDGALLGAPSPVGARRVWDVTVRSRDGRVRVRALIDARRGAVAALIGLNPEALERRVCNAANTAAEFPCVNPVRVEDPDPAAPSPSGDAEVDAAYDFAGDTYAFFADVLGRDSIDGAGMPIVQTVRYCEPGFACPYANAFWDGAQAVYGQGFVADDIVAHELSHGVTERTARLFYYYQSGAINESMSDIFGEITDIRRGLNTAGQRWLIGEDRTAGALRDMENPPAFGDPDRVRSPLYWDAPEDAGGVHSNSGIGNKAAVLMADGGTFNGEAVAAIGPERTARIHYRALTTLLRSASDYRDLALALPAACDGLVGADGAGGVIQPAHCDQVRAAVRATEMAQLPATAAVPAALCGPGTTGGQVVFSDDMEDPASGRWTALTLRGAGNPWGYASQYADPAWDPRYATSGQDNAYGDDLPADHDSVWAMSTAVSLPADAVLHFRHAFGFDAGARDGGVVEYSTDGGLIWIDAGPLMAGGNGYTATLGASGNALDGRPAFAGSSRGYTATRADLSSLAGRSVRIRFRLGTDAAGFGYGWFIDDVQIHRCVPDPAVSPPPPATPEPPVAPPPPATPAPVPPVFPAPLQPTPPARAGDTRRPAIVAARLTARWFPVRRQVPVSVIARSDEPGVIRAQVLRLVPGRRAGGRCRPGASVGPRCTRVVAVRTLGRRTATGAARLLLAGAGVRAPAPGRYRVRITATDRAGNRSAPRIVAFRVVR